MLYSRDSKGKIRFWDIKTQNDQVITTYGILGVDSSIQTSQYTAIPKGKKSPSEQAHAEAKSLYSKQLRHDYYESLDDIDKPSRIPMLAAKLKDHQKKVTFPCSVQPKLDGMRCAIFIQDNKIIGLSRGNINMEMTIIPNIFKEYFKLFPNRYIDGELYTPDVSFEENMSIAKTIQENEHKLIFNIFDVADTQIPLSWKERIPLIEQLKTFISNPQISFVDTFTIHSTPEIYQYHDIFCSQGFEGTMIRLWNAPYLFGGRSAYLLKHKDSVDAEFKIISVKTGKGKFENVPIFLCITDDGKTFDVLPKGTMSFKKDLLSKAQSFIGKMMKVRFQNFTEEGKPRFPRGLGIRLDA
jgi:ATP-dependent DNA ligase